ncbi:hypothetical protein ACHAWT_001119 [Skeletonema menzelii]
MPESVASEVVSAMVGGMFSASALYPLEVLKTRMQAESKKPTSNPQEETATNSTEDSSDNNNAANGSESSEKQTLKHQYSLAASEGMSSYASLMYQYEGGITPFYAGVGTSAVQSATEKALYFFAYTFFKNGYVNLTGSSNIGTISNLILGCMAEWAHLPVTLPIDCVTTAIQTDDKNRGAFVLLGNILSEKGIGGFYKGIQAYTVLCLKPAIQYTVYEQVKKIVLAARRGGNAGRKMVDESLSAAEAFLLGMVARIVATMLTYPYLRAKVMLQSTYGNAKIKPTIPQMISEQFSEGGVWGLYQGIGPELTRGVFSAALMMMVKERIGVMVRALIDGRDQQRQQQQR